MFDNEEQEEGAEEHVIALEEVTSPDLRSVVGSGMPAIDAIGTMPIGKYLQVKLLSDANYPGE